MEKEINFYSSVSSSSEHFKMIDPGVFEKTASAEYSQELQDFISNLKAENNRLYALINALSAGEYYGSNLNGDYFNEDDLVKSHGTFMENGHLYYHHKNKDKTKSAGKVIFSHYNPKMKRVELIVSIFADKDEAKTLISKINAGEEIFTSMGCSVPFDECSVCGNKAKSRTNYCDHLKYQMGQVLTDGRKVFAKNPNPKFFDISVVTIPADPTSSFLAILKNLPHLETNLNESLDKVAEISYIKLASKSAELKKEISDVNMETLTGDPNVLLNIAKGKLSTETIQKLAEYSIEEVFATMAALRIMPTKEDFQKIALYTSGRKTIADELDSKNLVFDENEADLSTEFNFGYEKANIKIAELLINSIPDCSWTKELIVARGICKIAQIQATDGKDRSMVKQLLFDYEPEPTLTATQNPIIPLGILGSLYYGYTKLFNDTSTGGFKSFMSGHPWLLPLLIGGAVYGATKMQDDNFSKTAGRMDRFFLSSLVAFPTSYYFAGKAQNKINNSQPISGTENFVRKHPALTGLVGAMMGTAASGALTRGIEKIGRLMYETDIKHVNQILSDLINGGETNGSNKY